MPIRSLSPSEAHARQRAGARLIDIRGEGERALGMADAAHGLAREVLEAEPERHLPDRDAEILLLCQRGLRSRQVAEFLAGQGYRNLASVEGGTEAWQAAS
ncbi:MAG TPA: rhodanese-like domain-containing protein, partial [Thermomonas sp.]|nr:rhodanese-like domain-containing protein [Thermomonas sp.]